MTWVALHLIGAVPTIINSWVQPDALVHCLKTGKPVLVLADAKSADAVAPFASELRAAGVGPILAWSTMSHVKHKDHPVRPPPAKLTPDGGPLQPSRLG